jgi:hypothetical protein
MCRYPTIIVVFILKKIYFTKDGAKKCPKGKLYSKYFNKLRSFKSQGFVVSKLQNNTESEIQTRVFEELNIELGNTRSLK